MIWQKVDEIDLLNKWKMKESFTDIPLDLSLKVDKDYSTLCYGYSICDTSPKLTFERNKENMLTHEIQQIDDGPLDLSVKCDRINDQTMSVDRNREQIVIGKYQVEDNSENLCEIGYRKHNKLVKPYTNRQRCENCQFHVIPTNPDSADNDLAMVSKRLELTVLKYYGHILNFDQRRVHRNNALKTYKVNFFH